MRITRSRTAVVASTLGLSLMLGGGTALADTSISERGKVGRHRLVDTETRPGAVCRYDAGGALLGVVVRPPVMFAVDRTARRDRQPVAWQAVLQEGLTSDPAPAIDVWEHAAVSPRQIARAADDTRAAFSRMGIRHPGIVDAEYRVRVRMGWLRPRDPSKLMGKSVHQVDFYRLGGPGGSGEVAAGSCPGGPTPTEN